MHPLTTDLAQQILALVRMEAYSLLGAIQDGKTVLGGSAGSDGGTGEPPAGFVGQLTQSNVTYDTAGSSRACSAGSAGSSSLVDNLDAIRLGIEICDDVIGDRHIDWGTGAGQVSAVDVPFQSSSGSISATDVREAIEEAWVHGGVTGGSVVGSGVTGQVAYWTSTDTIGGDAGFTYDAATDTITVTGGIKLAGASAANIITVRDDMAQAMNLVDVGGLEYMRIVSTNAQPVVHFNQGEADIDTIISASGITNALFVQGLDGAITVGGPSMTVPDGWIVGIGLALERIVFDAAGDISFMGCKVGIGTLGPKGHLSIKADGSMAIGPAAWTGTALHIDNSGIVAGAGVFGGGIVFGELGNANNRSAAIASYQPGGDVDAAGLAFFIHGSTHAADMAQVMTITSAGDVGVGTTGPNAKIESLATTEQLRLSYDADSYASFTVAADSDLTITPAETGQVIIQPTTDSLTAFQVLDADGGTPVLSVDTTNERVGISQGAPGGKLQINQGDASGAIPTLILTQADISEEFIRLFGTAAGGVLTRSIVDEGDQGSETREGWLKVYIVDYGDQITDQAYFIPIYTLSA